MLLVGMCSGPSVDETSPPASSEPAQPTAQADGSSDDFGPL